MVLGDIEVYLQRQITVMNPLCHLSRLWMRDCWPENPCLGLRLVEFERQRRVRQGEVLIRRKPGREPSGRLRDLCVGLQIGVSPAG